MLFLSLVLSWGSAFADRAFDAAVEDTRAALDRGEASAAVRAALTATDLALRGSADDLVTALELQVLAMRAANRYAEAEKALGALEAILGSDQLPASVSEGRGRESKRSARVEPEWDFDEPRAAPRSAPAPRGSGRRLGVPFDITSENEDEVSEWVSERWSDDVFEVTYEVSCPSGRAEHQLHWRTMGWWMRVDGTELVSRGRSRVDEELGRSWSCGSHGVFNDVHIQFDGEAATITLNGRTFGPYPMTQDVSEPADWIDFNARKGTVIRAMEFVSR